MYEQEADRVADQVMRMPKPSHRGECSCGGTCSKCRATSREQTQLRAKLAPASHAGGALTAPQVREVLQEPGQPLDAQARAFVEPRLGRDFSHVRVHTDARASRSAQALQARAYTFGRDIVFRAGEYAPGTTAGRRLLAHELTHTVQQSTGARGPASPTIQKSSLRIARQEAETGPGSTVPPSIRTVKVWLNAFIPKHVPGLTVPAPKRKGETMVPGPLPGLSDCFLTDQRTFDPSIHASSRMHSEIEIDIKGPSEKSQWHNCDATHEIDCEDGELECDQKGGTSRMKFSNLRGSLLTTIKVDLKAASNNPCYRGSPDIDYEGTFTISPAARTVAFEGKIDEFPAYEVYAAASSGAGAAILQIDPPKGNTPGDLFAKANRAVKGKTEI